MSNKSYNSGLFKRIIDLGVVREAEVDDLVRIWRVGTGDEKAITLANFVGTVDRDLGDGDSLLTEIVEALESAVTELEERVTVLEEDGGGGHIIVDENDTALPQQPKLKFERLIVTDDDTNEQTIVSRPSDTSINLTRPSDPLEGDEWTDPETFKTYKYYDSYWVELPSSGGGGGSGGIESVTGGFVDNTDPLNPIIEYPEAVERENNTVLFDKDYVIGNATARTGNVIFDFTGAKLMATTMMLHNHSSAPTFPAQAVRLGGGYILNQNNYIYFQLTRKTASSEIVLYTISQVL